VHVLFEANPGTQLPRLVQRFKGGSSALARKERHARENGAFGWTKGYSIETVSPRALPAVRAYVRDFRPVRSPVQPPVASADDSTSVSVYGAYGAFTPSPAPDSNETVFTIPFAYINGTSQLYRDTGSGNVALTRGVGYFETDPAAGEFTLATPPDTGDTLYVTCRVAGSV